MNTLIITMLVFVGINILNVVLNTMKSILTVNGTILSASVINCITFIVYTYANIITVTCDGISIHVRAILIGIINFVFVAIVKYAEKKMQKEKIWRVEYTALKEEKEDLIVDLNRHNLQYNYIENVGNWVIFNIYSETQKESIAVKEILKNYNGKYFVTETKAL